MIEITWKWNVKCQDRNWMRMTWGFYWIIPCDSWSGSSAYSLYILSTIRLLRRKMRQVWMKEDLLEDQYQRTSEVNRRFFWRDTSRHDLWKTMALTAFQCRLAMFAEPRRYFPFLFLLFAARTLQHLLQIGQYRRQPSRCCNFINTDLQSSEFCIFLYDVCQWLLSWVQLMLWTLAVASSMRFLMLFASFLFILSEVQNFLFVQATPGRHSGPSILEDTFQWAFNLKLIVEEKGVRVALHNFQWIAHRQHRRNDRDHMEMECQMSR